ncbi:DUF1491 family protein [Rhizobium halophilum]|uniref:DUF1491 family protein n=1 Tax=Rhizobium halophilum TaxID=2846852 RepID=UPI001EFCE7EC|nr:DUF1491 family protein [Rhizobium halophilum]MCF6370435.1 DUF1491 family protein [Rhizobium halophilum]
MRIRSDIFVSALTRRVFSAGGFAAVEHKGSEEAGAVFVRQRHRDGTETLYGPAPQNVFEEEVTERQFEKRLDRVEPERIDDLIKRERSFDRDLWLIELEVSDVDGLFAVVDAAP